MNLSAAIADLALIDAAVDTLTRRKNELRAALLDHARLEQGRTGAAPTYRLKELGTVGLTDPAGAIKVVDADALAVYVADRYPDEVVPKVRPTFVDPLLDRLHTVPAPDGDGFVVIDDAGERVPGVTWRTAAPTLQVRLTAGLKELAAERVAAAGLTLPVIVDRDEPATLPAVVAPTIGGTPLPDGADTALPHHPTHDLEARP